MARCYLTIENLIWCIILLLKRNRTYPSPFVFESRDVNVVPSVTCQFTPVHEVGRGRRTRRPEEEGLAEVAGADERRRGGGSRAAARPGRVGRRGAGAGPTRRRGGLAPAGDEGCGRRGLTAARQGSRAAGGADRRAKGGAPRWAWRARCGPARAGSDVGMRPPRGKSRLAAGGGQRPAPSGRVRRRRRRYF